MKYERWLIPETDDAAVEALMDAGYPYLVSTVLASRRRHARAGRRAS